MGRFAMDFRIQFWLRLKGIAAILMMLVCGACTSTTFTDLSQQELHEKILAGEIMQPGGEVTIVTMDGKQHNLRVSSITADSVVGKESSRTETAEDGFEENQDVVFRDVSIPVTDIVSVEKLQITHPAGQAAVFAGYSLTVILLLALPAAIVGAFAL
jgi:hypothetical protein